MHFRLFGFDPSGVAFDDSLVVPLPRSPTSGFCPLLEKFRSRKADLTVAENSSCRWQIRDTVQYSGVQPTPVSVLQQFREGRAKDLPAPAGEQLEQLLSKPCALFPH